MGEVVALDAARPHLEGPARCVKCLHEFRAVAPVGTTLMTCPNCGSDNAARMAMVQRVGLHWVCNCGNALFFVTDEAIYCPNCGADQVFP